MGQAALRWLWQRTSVFRADSRISDPLSDDGAALNVRTLGLENVTIAEQRFGRMATLAAKNKLH